MTGCGENRMVLLFPNAERDQGLAATRRTLALLRGADVPVRIACERGSLPEEMNRLCVPVSEGFARAGLVVVFGGDGTILRAARLASDRGTPILGVNLGNKGFMAELERNELDKVFEAVRGNYRPDRRMMLDVSVLRGGETAFSDYALNEASVNGVARVISVTVRCDGALAASFRGDGVIAATPTGSTAYSLSAGGPIVEPEAENILITPICAHVVGARPFVLSPGRVAQITVSGLSDRPAYLTADGGEPFRLAPGDEITVRRSERETVLCNVTGRSFYERIAGKL